MLPRVGDPYADVPAPGSPIRHQSGHVGVLRIVGAHPRVAGRPTPVYATTPAWLVGDAPISPAPDGRSLVPLVGGLVPLAAVLVADAEDVLTLPVGADQAVLVALDGRRRG